MSSDPYEMLLLSDNENRQLDELLKEFEAAESDCVGDFGIEVWEAGGYFEVGRNIADGYPPRVKHEFLRIKGIV